MPKSPQSYEKGQRERRKQLKRQEKQERRHERNAEKRRAKEEGALPEGQQTPEETPPNLVEENSP